MQGVKPVTVADQTNRTSTTPQQQSPIKETNGKPPVTTVFVGNIAEKAPDPMIKLLLQKCGNVLSWKRVQGASGKLQGFGFCEYEDPEATLRCIRLLNEKKIGDKKLVVKVDHKTNKFLNDYKRKKKAAAEGIRLETRHQGGSSDSEDEGDAPSAKKAKKDDEEEEEEEDMVDAMTLRDDETIKMGFQKIFKEYSHELARITESEIPRVPVHETSPKRETAKQKRDRLEGPRHLTIEDMDLDNERMDLINREIESFRNRHKDEDETEEQREREKEIREREAQKRRRMEQEASTYNRSGLAARMRSEMEERRSSSRTKTSRRSRSRSTSRDPGVSRSRSSRHDEQEDAMRKKLERELRKKEEAYQERLKLWEMRERKKLKDLEREADKERRTESEAQAEARRLKEFFEDYDDDKQDAKYYKGRELQKRVDVRQLEESADERDRAKEMEEMEAMRAKLLEEGAPDAEERIFQMEQSMEEHLLRRLQLDFDNLPVQEDIPAWRESKREVKRESKEVRPPSTSVREGKVSSGRDGRDTSREGRDTSREGRDTSSKERRENKAHVEEAPKERSVLQEHNGASSTKVRSRSRSESDDEDVGQYSFEAPENSPSPPPPPSRPAPELSRNPSRPAEVRNASPPHPTQPQPGFINSLQSSESVSGDKVSSEPAPPPPSNAATLAMDKKQIIKQIIDQIPTQKEVLFAYTIDWSMVDGNFVTSRIRPWVDKKIKEYIGEEEPTLSNFICDQVLSHNPPDKILSDIAMVLDEEAEVFVVKMWRLLIYVIKEKNAGLDKS